MHPASKETFWELDPDSDREAVALFDRVSSSEARWMIHCAVVEVLDELDKLSHAGIRTSGFGVYRYHYKREASIRVAMLKDYLSHRLCPAYTMYIGESFLLDSSNGGFVDVRDLQ